MNEIIHHHTNFYDFSYRLIQKYWGNGYATEVGKATIHTIS